jgi:hypothetical protein
MNGGLLFSRPISSRRLGPRMAYEGTSLGRNRLEEKKPFKIMFNR